MSTIIMSACWPLQGMSPAQKSVLISLADNANDEGVCWPSVRHIAKRTCLSERAVQGAIRWLVNAGLLVTKERDGRSTVYEITPAAYAPQQEMRGAANAPTPAAFALTPADAAPAPADAAPRTVKNHKGTNKEPKSGIACDHGIPDQLMADYLAVRKAKRVGPLSATAIAGIKREAEKAGISLEAAVTACVEFGWAGFNAGWYESRMLPAAPGRARPLPNKSFAQQRIDAEIADFVNGGSDDNVIDMEVPRVGF